MAIAEMISVSVGAVSTSAKAALVSLAQYRQLGRAAGGRSSLPSASRCLRVSGPRLATTRASHARSSSES